MCYVRAYLRASTDEQDANRARDQLKTFAAERGLQIVAWYTENNPAAGDWAKLKTELQAKHVRVVALDLPTSWLMAAKADEFTGRMFEAINGMLLDMLAAVARKDYDDRRRRQAQGQAKAKADGRYKGRIEDVARNAGIASMLKAGQSWSAIQAATGCSRATIAKIAKRQAKAA